MPFTYDRTREARRQGRCYIREVYHEQCGHLKAYTIKCPKHTNKKLRCGREDRYSPAIEGELACPSCVEIDAAIAAKEEELRKARDALAADDEETEEGEGEDDDDDDEDDEMAGDGVGTQDEKSSATGDGNAGGVVESVE